VPLCVSGDAAQWLKLTSKTCYDHREAEWEAERTSVHRHLLTSIMVEIRQYARKNVPSAVASLGWVSPGTANEGVTPIFSWKWQNITWRPFFSHHRLLPILYGVTRIYFLLKTLTTCFGSSLSLLVISLGCHPLEGVTRGGPRPLVTPLPQWYLHKDYKYMPL